MDQEFLNAIRQIVREEISGVKGDVSSLKDDVSSLKGDVSSLKTDVSLLKNDVSTLKKDVAEMKPQLEENTQMLRTLLARTDNHGAMLEQLNLRVSRLEGNKKKYQKLNDDFYHHSHKVLVEIKEPVFKTDSDNHSDS
ncbi:hypothetical protein SAMN04488598_104121 [Halanaerobium congolense]|uniref:Uncharacterized protein n=1 Tax=Halanaerobium congolense TaxID=54121 RepID=A0A1H9Z777_9FIRM|nr:hypothetical protein [Halanaerobium congolense]PTX17480.1 hypothetical protein C7953_2273 [Halanaerobium congolense]SDE98726.1 hypothetical protein SAMN04488598_104121 [Halanaerobium congolense]SES77354.1 hypothetical protein SAMN04515652_105118 [Halanaerobium congolense]SFP04796.1 hypothetical protein SAMN04488596_1053 [Halanaerobium congolense]